MQLDDVEVLHQKQKACEQSKLLRFQPQFLLQKVGLGWMLVPLQYVPFHAQKSELEISFMQEEQSVLNRQSSSVVPRGACVALVNKGKCNRKSRSNVIEIVI